MSMIVWVLELSSFAEAWRVAGDHGRTIKSSLFPWIAMTLTSWATPFKLGHASEHPRSPKVTPR
jgi:hypothetical protein